MAFSGIYDTINTGSAVNRNLNDKTRSLFINDVADEELEFQKRAKAKEKASGWGRLIGGGGSLLASLLLPGIGTLAAAALAGGLSYGGQKLGASTTPKLDAGKFNMQDDRDYKDMFNEGMIANAGSDALSAGLLKHAGVFDKGVEKAPIIPEPKPVGMSKWGVPAWRNPSMLKETIRPNLYDLYDIMGYRE